MKTQALVVTGLNRIELRPLEVPKPAAGQVQVEMLYTCISPGTELRVMAGHDLADGFPYVPGYAAVGRVLETGPGLNPGAGLIKGVKVFGGGTGVTEPYHKQWGGHVGLAVSDAESWVAVPEAVDAKCAALSKLGAIALHGVRLAGLSPNDRVAVVGLGVLGQLSARLAANTGASVVACDLNPSRVEIARRAGLIARQSATTLAETFADTHSQGFDVVIDVTGAAAVLPHAIELLRQTPWGREDAAGPRYVMQGSYPGDVTFPYHPMFMREASLLLPRDNTPGDKMRFLDLLASGQIAVGDLISEVASPDEAADIYENLREPNSKIMTAVFDWQRIT